MIWERPQQPAYPRELIPVATKYSAILLYGPPGSGKGTQAQVLSMLTGHVHLSAGDIFRSLPPTSPLKSLQQQYLDRGLLIPDELAVQIWQQHIEELTLQRSFSPEEHLVIADGMPRTAQQALMLSQAMTTLRVLVFETQGEDPLIERLQHRASQQQRSDDRDLATMQRRIRVYREQTEGVLQTFPQETMIRIRADQRRHEVQRDILNSLGDVLNYPYL